MRWEPRSNHKWPTSNCDCWGERLQLNEPTSSAPRWTGRLFASPPIDAGPSCKRRQRTVVVWLLCRWPFVSPTPSTSRGNSAPCSRRDAERSAPTSLSATMALSAWFSYCRQEPLLEATQQRQCDGSQCGLVSFRHHRALVLFLCLGVVVGPRNPCSRLPAPHPACVCACLELKPSNKYLQGPVDNKTRKWLLQVLLLILILFTICEIKQTYVAKMTSILHCVQRFMTNKTYSCAHTTVALPTVTITNTINMFVVSLAGDKTTRAQCLFHPIIGDSISTSLLFLPCLVCNPLSVARLRICKSRLAWTNRRQSPAHCNYVY